MKHCIILVLLCVIVADTGYAQAADKEKAAAAAALKRIATAYKNALYLSFDVAYYYADEQSPAVYLDSLKGQCKLNGTSYWYLLNNTECIANDQYMVVLYKEDSLMYLSKPAAVAQSANPMAMIDSFLVRYDNLAFHTSNINGLQQVTINFPDKGVYKSIRYDIDSRTGLLTGMRSIIQSTQLVDPSLRATAANGQSGYAIVDVLFSRYASNSFNGSVFDMSRYFKKEGGQYHSVAPYDQYKIFVGTPNL